jgi:hypothetical protein
MGGRSFAFKNTHGRPSVAEFPARVLADETGTPALYTSGQNFNWRAYYSIRFPDQRRLRFLVRGTRRSNAIVTGQVAEIPVV